MRNHSLPLMAGLLVVLGAAAGPAFADDPSVDRLLASQCAQCHGTDGRAVGEIDSLAGKSFSGLFGDTREMKDKDPDDIMHRQARGYSDDQLRRIAEYFSMLPEKEEEEKP